MSHGWVTPTFHDFDHNLIAFMECNAQVGRFRIWYSLPGPMHANKLALMSKMLRCDPTKVTTFPFLWLIETDTTGLKEIGNGNLSASSIKGWQSFLMNVRVRKSQRRTFPWELPVTIVPKTVLTSIHVIYPPSCPESVAQSSVLWSSCLQTRCNHHNSG